MKYLINFTAKVTLAALLCVFSSNNYALDWGIFEPVDNHVDTIDDNIFTRGECPITRKLSRPSACKYKRFKRKYGDKFDELLGGFSDTDHVSRIVKDGKNGAIDVTGKIVIPAIYKRVSHNFPAGFSIVSKDGKKWGAINEKGETLIPFEYDDGRTFYDITMFRAGEKYVFLTKQGKLIAPAKYNRVEGLRDGMARVMVEGRWGVINSRAEEIVAPVYRYIGAFSESGLATAENESRQYGSIDKEGNVIIPFKYDRALSFSEGMALVHEDGKSGYIDTKGSVVIPIMYDELRYFIEDLAVFRMGDRYGYINKKNQAVVPAIYNLAFAFSGGRALVVKAGKYGFIDSSGKQVIPLVYDYASSFHYGKAMVKKDGKTFFINKKGEAIN